MLHLLLKSQINLIKMPKEDKKPAITSANETVTEFVARKHADGSEEWKLPSGAICVRKRFTARDSKKCIQIAGGDEDLMMDAIIAETCTFNGKKMTAEEIADNLDGMDYLELLGKLSGVK